MLSAQTKLRLVHALANQELADELEKRLSQEWPGMNAAADLATYKEDARLREHLVVALASKEAGDELADRLDKAKTILAAVADGEETPAVLAQKASLTITGEGILQPIIIEATTAGAAGNLIALEFDGVKDVDTVIADWNAANPASTVVLVQGDGAFVVSGIDGQLSGGSDEVPASDANTGPAIQAFGQQSLSPAFMERLTIALADERAAREFKELHDQWVAELND